MKKLFVTLAVLCPVLTVAFAFANATNSAFFWNQPKTPSVFR